MSWLSELLQGGKNPADAANPYIGQIPGATSPYFDPYFQAGKGQLPGLQDIYKKLLGDPGAFMNKIGEGYKESPGLKNQIAQAMQGAGHAAAAGGMAGSPAHEQENMQLASDISSKDYNNWMQNALGMFGSGLSGSQGMAGMGQKAGSDMASMIAQALSQQGAYAYQGQAGQNQNQNSLWSNILGGLGAFPGIFGDWKNMFQGK